MPANIDAATMDLVNDYVDDVLESLLDGSLEVSDAHVALVAAIDTASSGTDDDFKKLMKTRG